MKELKENLREGDIFIIITGGPCYGKSSLASQLGHDLFDENEYNYVIWISMRGLFNPQLEDVADKILKEFEIDTTEMKGEIVEILRRKFELITAKGKRALLIFDNADDLIAPPIDKSSKLSTFSELSRHIRGYSRETIRAIFTTRIYNKTAGKEEHYTVKLKHLSDEESKSYLQQELQEKKELNKEKMVKDIVVACHGLPFALRMVCSCVNEMRSLEMIKDYINDLKRDPLQTVGEDDKELDDDRLFVCFNLSLERLDEIDRKLLSVLAVFPSRFSYTYVKKLLSCTEKDDAINPRKLLIKLEKHSLIQDDSRADHSNAHRWHADEANQDGCVSEQYYVIHSFFCQYIQDQYWNNIKRHDYLASYFKLYTTELFVLGRKSLEKDSYVSSWAEYMGEQHNFDYVMTQFGKSCDQDDCPSDIKKAILEELAWDTPNFISMCLFCIDLTKPSLLLKFVEVCENFADDKQKKNIWCCRYDLNMKYFRSEIEDPCRKLEPDEYGQALLDKRRLAKKLHAYFPNKKVESFAMIRDELIEFSKRIDSLECVPLKNYFKHKILKLHGSLLKKGLNVEELDVAKVDCFKMFRDALDICNEHFGKSWLTIDCYNQLGKMSWRVGENNEALQAFDKAIDMTKSMSLRDNKKFGSCLLDKGRFLIDVGSEEQKEEGRTLLEDAIYRCNEYSDTKFWCQAMGSLLTITKSKVKEVKERFFQTEKLNSSFVDLMDKAIKLDIESSDESFEEETFLEIEKAKAKDLSRAIDRLEADLQEVQNVKNDEHVYAKRHCFVWQMRAALRYSHVMLLSERKKFAENALIFMETCSFIDRRNEDSLRALMNQECDAKEEELIRQMHFVDRIGSKLLKANKEDELMHRYSILLMNCEDYQKLWSSIVLKRARDRPFLYEKVTDFLVTQTEPCEELLKLVLYKFEYSIKVYQREADEAIIIEKSRRGVEDLRRAIEHVEERLLPHMSYKAQGVVKRWYKSIALETDHILLDDDQRIYAEKVLQIARDLKQEEKKKLKNIISRKGTKEEQECRRKKALLCKVTKFMRQNGMQDDLEKRYDGFIIECASFHRIRFEMVKFILEKKNVEIQKFGKYLSYLIRDFQRGALTKGWDYQFVVDLADQLFSEEVDPSSRKKNFDFYYYIFGSLQFLKESSGVVGKLKFQFLVIFALKVGKDIRDITLRKQDAQRALEIFSNIEVKYRDGKLSKYHTQLLQLSRQ